MQGGARCEVRGVLGPYVAAPRERANAADGPFSAACKAPPTIRRAGTRVNRSTRANTSRGTALTAMDAGMAPMPGTPGRVWGATALSPRRGMAGGIYRGRKRPRLGRLSAGVAREGLRPAGRPAEGTSPCEDKAASRGAGGSPEWQVEPQAIRRGDQTGRGKEASVLDALAKLADLGAKSTACGCDRCVLGGAAGQRHRQQFACGGAHFRALSRVLKNSLSPRLLKKVQMQGGAHSEARGVLGPYVAAPRERANAPPAAVPSAAGRAVRPFSAAC